MQNTDKTGSEGFRFVHVVEQAKESRTNGVKKQIKQIAVFQEEGTKLRIDGKNAVAMLNFNDLKSHRIRAVNGIFCSAGRAQSAFAAKRNKFEFPTFFTGIHSTAVGRIPTVDHFIDIFHYDGARFDYILDVFVMVSENLLKNVHVLIISYVRTKQNPLMIEGAGGADSSKTIFYFIGNFSKTREKEKSLPWSRQT